MDNNDNIQPVYNGDYKGKRFKFDLAHRAVIDEIIPENPIYPIANDGEIQKIVDFLNVQWEEIQKLKHVNNTNTR